MWSENEVHTGWGSVGTHSPEHRAAVATFGDDHTSSADTNVDLCPDIHVPLCEDGYYNSNRAISPLKMSRKRAESAATSAALPAPPPTKTFIQRAVESANNVSLKTVKNWMSTLIEQAKGSGIIQQPPNPIFRITSHSYDSMDCEDVSCAHSDEYFTMKQTDESMRAPLRYVEEDHPPYQHHHSRQQQDTGRDGILDEDDHDYNFTANHASFLPSKKSNFSGVGFL